MGKKKKNKGYELYVMEAKVRCWKCMEHFDAAGILYTDDKGSHKIIHIQTMTSDFDSYMSRYFPQIKKRLVKSVGKVMYVNVCPHCGITNGDVPLHGVGGVFEAYSEKAKNITMYPVKEKFNIYLSTGKVIDIDDTIMRFASIQKKEKEASVKEGDIACNEFCQMCGSKSIVTKDRWLCYDFRVDVCMDCELTRRSIDKVVFNPGRFAIYDEFLFPPEAYADEISFRDFEKNCGEEILAYQ